LAKAITKCQTAVYRHADMADLEQTLQRARDARLKLIFTDGVFSMEGDIAKLPDIVALARQYGAVVAVDDSHATGVLGKNGRGTAEHYGMLGDVDIITSTLGKALGGAAGGFTAGPAALADYLTQRSRPQLFSNALPPTVAGSALAAVRYVERHPELVRRLHDTTLPQVLSRFRGLKRRGIAFSDRHPYFGGRFFDHRGVVHASSDCHRGAVGGRGRDPEGPACPSARDRRLRQLQPL